MGNLTDLISEKTETEIAIEKYWKTRGDAEPARGYLGASSIGAACSRQLWYSFRKCSTPNFSGRLYRLFNRGHREEPTFVEELRGIGCDVHEFDSEGNQFEVIACEGHFKGHTDGAALGVPEAPKTWHLLEMKTASAKSFRSTKKHGCEKDKPQHFAQMQVYMHLTGLKRALYMVVNKDTDEVYTERLRHNSKQAQVYIDKAEMIINSTEPPERISEKNDYYLCKFCDARDLCHGLSEVAVPIPALNCRQCVHSTAVQDGKWHCDKLGSETDGTPCDQHLLIPALVGFAEPTDSFVNQKDGSNVIEFTTEDGTIFHHGSDFEKGQFNSKMLLTTPKSLVSLPNLRRSGVQFNLESKYQLSNEGVESVWKGRIEDVKNQFQQSYSVPLSNPDATQEGEGWTIAEFKELCCIINYGGKYAEIREIK